MRRLLHVLTPRRSAEVEERLVGYLDGSPQDFGCQRTTWTLEVLAVQFTLDAGVRLRKRHMRNVMLANQVRRGRPRVGLRLPVRGRRRILNEIDRLVESADERTRSSMWTRSTST